MYLAVRLDLTMTYKSIFWSLPVGQIPNFKNSTVQLDRARARREW
jgi:hypothetical protein